MIEADAAARNAVQHGSKRSCFTVHVDDLVLGLPVSETQTIFRISELTRIPLGPRHVVGLANLRGRVMTVISLRSQIGGKVEEVIQPGALAIAIHVDGEDYALVVDKVGEVIEVDPSRRTPLPPHLNEEHARITEGLYKIGDLLLPVLNVAELLTSTQSNASKRSGTSEASRMDATHQATE